MYVYMQEIDKNRRSRQFDKSSGSMPNIPMPNLYLKISQARAKNIVSIKIIIGNLYLMTREISVQETMCFNRYTRLLV